MKQPKPPTVDFETHGIEGRPKYPPIPVGVSIKYWGKKSKYYAFGHIDGNNCSFGKAVKEVKKAFSHPDGVIFQNAKFDVDVADVHMGIPIPDWDKIHDTMFLLYLDDPHQMKLGLKESAERLLNWNPEERDASEEWLIKNQPILDVKVSKSKSSPHYAGRYLAYVPVKILGPYAMGDTDRTEALFKLLWKKTKDREMLEAYDRERRLMPILLEMERQGLPVNLTQLRKDVQMYEGWREKIDTWVYRRLKSEPFKINSGDQLMKAMIAAGAVNEDEAPLTATGKFQTNKEALLVAVTDKVLLAVLTYRSQLNTCMNTFMIPWLITAERSKGLIFTTWNQTKNPKGAGSVGTRTGRLSSNPNFQNIPNVFKALFHHQDKKKKLPKCPWKDLPSLPKIRGYVVPFKGEVFIDRDYSQQEPRILAHFDGGALLEKYLEDPWIDMHDYAKEELAKMGKYYERKPVKNTNLGLIYGMGAPLLAVRNDMSVKEADTLKKAVKALYPGLAEMYKDMKQRMIANLPIRTWGGREYYCEPAKVINGRLRTFDYKMVNVLIQGSAADCTKEAIIRFHSKKQPDWKIVINVHDQITASVPRKDFRKAMEVLRVCMEEIEFDVAMLTEGTYSHVDWDNLKDYDIKGELVA